MQEMAFSKKVGKSRWEVLTGLVLTVLNLMQEKALFIQLEAVEGTLVVEGIVEVYYSQIWYQVVPGTYW